MPPDFSVPSYLLPPSQAEQAHIKLAQDEVQQRAGSMLRKQIGVQRMQSQAQQLIANGVDESTARKQALLDNASLIFADNPEAVVRLNQNEEANKIRQRSLDQTQLWHESQMQLREDQLSELKRKNDAIADYRDSLLDYKSRDLDRKTEIGNLNAQIRQQQQDRLSNPPPGSKLTPDQKGQVASLRKQIDILNKQRLGMEEPLSGGADPNMTRTKRFGLAVQAGNLQKQIDSILGGGASPAGKPYDFDYDAVNRKLLDSTAAKGGLLPNTNEEDDEE